MSMENGFAELVPVAKRELLRIMTMSRDDKVVVSTARMILEASGNLDASRIGGAQIVINNSQVQLLISTAKEIAEHGGST